MERNDHDLSRYETAARAYGPGYSGPPYVRAPYPVEVLPLVLGRFAGDAGKAMGVPPESIATHAIATCAAAIGNTCRIRISKTWTEPSVIWAVLLLESGSLKTPAYNAAMEPLRAAQRLSEESHEEAVKAYRQSKAQYESDVKFNASQPGQPMQLAEPDEPRPVDLYTSDSTVEALAMLFASNPRGLALTRDELSGFFASFGAYKGGRGGDEATYLEFYNAGSVKLNRASGKRIYVNAAALSIFGTCQPAVFADAIGANGKGSNQVDNGLAARFLIASPGMKAKRWQDPQPFEARHYHAMVATLLTIPLIRDADERVEPALIDMSPDALAAFAKFVDEHGQQTAAIGSQGLRYHYAKLEAVAARLALIFYLCDVATKQHMGDPQIQLRHVYAGIAVARWHGLEATRIYDGYESATERETRELLNEVRDHGGVITPREMGRVRRRWNDPVACELALRKLARHGHGIMEVVQGSGENGRGRPSLRFRLFTKGSDTSGGVDQASGNADLTEIPSTEA